MPTIEGFDCFPLEFDADGALTSRKAFDALTASAAAPDVTDAIVIAHGFRNDANDATTLYTKFLKTLRKNLKRPEFSDMARRKFVVAVVYWPSKPHRENPEPEEKGARTLRNPKQEIADAKAQLRELKAGGTKTQRAKIDRAITLLPMLNTSTRAQDQFVKLALSLAKRPDADQTEGLPQIRARSGSDSLRGSRRLARPARAASAMSSAT